MLYEGLIVDNTYKVIGEIGKGGMGVIYLAYHMRLQKDIVMKKIKGRFANDALIRNEVDILKGLHHPYLPQVYDFIEYESELYTIIDYINGYDLNYYIMNCCVFEESQLIKWFRQLCEVLEYLHTHNPPIFHTDIKPANIIVTDDGNICLIDFGISLNNSGSVVGLSEDYCSPEQYMNVISGNYAQVDCRTDIYSLGATFYHLMTGVKPSISNLEQPVLSQYALNYSEPFVAVVEKAMSRDMGQRFMSAGQMLKAIDDMRKQDVRYKRYVLLQLASSLAAGIMILSGAFMVYYGYRGNVISDYKGEYSDFIRLNNSGDTQGTLDVGTSILGNRSYASLIDENIRAQILHGIGDCFFNDGDYANAARYYKEAVNYAEYTDNSEIYYRDYTFSLIRNDNFTEADKFIEQIRGEYPDSPIVSLVEAELSFRRRDYKQALESVDICLASVIDSDNTYTAYILRGDICMAACDYAGSVASYEEALKIDENVTVLRKLGAACLAYANSKTYADVNILNQAKSCYRNICDNYYPTVDDYINLAQTYRFLGQPGDCIVLLNEYLSSNEADFRIYIQLALAGDEAGSTNTASYCEKAHNMYQALSSEEKDSLDSSDLNMMKTLYRKYCSAVW